MIGIYKITSPSGKVYIGQSTDIEFRINNYKYFNNYRFQIKLKNSFNKYGLENHKFEIIEECVVEILNERERYWQEFYNVLENGLNCRLTRTNDKSGKVSEETKAKMRLNRVGTKGMKYSEETKKKMRGKVSPRKGKPMAEKVKKYIEENVEKMVLNIDNGIYYKSIKEASFVYNIPYSTLCWKLRSSEFNNTLFILV